MNSLEDGTDWQLLDTGQSLPDGGDLLALMSAALIPAQRLVRSKSGTIRPIGFNFLLERVDGKLFDGDLNPARLVEQGGRVWGLEKIRQWIVKYQIRRAAVFMDVKPEDPSMKPDTVAIVGIEAEKGIAHVFRSVDLLDDGSLTPIREGPAVGFWFDAFSLGLVGQAPEDQR